MQPNVKQIAIVRIDTSELVYAGEFDPAIDTSGWTAARFLEPGTCYAKADTTAQAVFFAQHAAAQFRRQKLK